MKDTQNINLLMVSLCLKQSVGKLSFDMIVVSYIFLGMVYMYSRRNVTEAEATLGIPVLSTLMCQWNTVKNILAFKHCISIGKTSSLSIIMVLLHI